MSTKPTYETRKLYDVASELLHIVEKRQQEGGVSLIGEPTGFADLDDLIGGWRKNEMYAIGGRTGSGKSAFTLSTALNAARKGASAFYLSLEMSAHILALRTLSAMTGVPAMKIEKGQLHIDTLKQIQAAAETFSSLPIYFYDHPTTSTELETILNIHKNSNGLDIAVVDYLALLKDKGNTPYERITNISINLRGLASTFDIPLLAVSQLNRSSMSRVSDRPLLQDLKESGQVENDAGAVIFPYRPKNNDEENPNPDIERAELIIAKNRHGPSEVSIEVEFLPKQMLWRPIQYEVKNPPSAERDRRSIA